MLTAGYEGTEPSNPKYLVGPPRESMAGTPLGETASAASPELQKKGSHRELQLQGQSNVCENVNDHVKGCQLDRLTGWSFSENRKSLHMIIMVNNDSNSPGGSHKLLKKMLSLRKHTTNVPIQHNFNKQINKEELYTQSPHNVLHYALFKPVGSMP